MQIMLHRNRPHHYHSKLNHIPIVDLHNLENHHLSKIQDNNQDQRNLLHNLLHSHLLQDNHLKYLRKTHPNNLPDQVQHRLHNHLFEFPMPMYRHQMT